MVVTDSGDVILDHYPLGYPLLNKHTGSRTFMVYTTLHKCQPGLRDLTTHTLNIQDLLALTYHALVGAFAKAKQLNQCTEIPNALKSV